jgi:hypothetical protein
LGGGRRREPLEDDGLVAVDPFTGAAADLDGRELGERNPEPLGSTCPVQDESVLGEFEPAARGRAVASTPDDGVVVRAFVNALGRQACSSKRVAEAIALADARGVREGSQPLHAEVPI